MEETAPYVFEAAWTGREAETHGDSAVVFVRQVEDRS